MDAQQELRVVAFEAAQEFCIGESIDNILEMAEKIYKFLSFASHQPE